MRFSVLLHFERDFMTRKDEAMSEWRPYEDQCNHCGDDAEVLTDSGKDNCAYDGDKARCVGCGCPGVVSIEEEGISGGNGINWHDEADCDCEWCAQARPTLMQAIANT